jgi:hypothetical protein
MPRRDVTKNFIRERQFPPSRCDRRSFRMVKRSKGQDRHLLSQGPMASWAMRGRNKSPIDPQATMNRKRFKPSLASICAVSVDLRLTPGGKEATRKAFTEADLKRALEHGDKKSAGRLASWHRPAKISQLRADASAALPAGQPARPQPLRSLHGRLTLLVM